MPTALPPQPRTTSSFLTEVVDARRGAVRASGHLTVQGADLLRGTVEHLHRRGHSTVVLDLKAVAAADRAGLSMLDDLAASLADAGGELLVLDAPAASG